MKEEALETTFGLRACLAIFAKRPGDITRIAVSRASRAEAAELVKWAETKRVTWEERRDADLEQIAESSQHEGLCVLAKPRKWTPPGDLSDVLTRGKGLAIALDRVRNPYNVGAVVRSAAFFGLDAAIFGAPAPHPGLAPTAIRVAEGGAEHMALVRTTDLADTLGRLRARGARVVGADGASKVSAIGHVFARPTILVLGNEREGLADRVRKQCDAVVSIPGSGAIESLNVGVAAGVLISEMARSKSAAR